MLERAGIENEDGSFISDNIRAVAAELEKMHSEEIGKITERIFPTLAKGNDLTLAAENFGVDRKPAVNATVNLKITGEEGTVINDELCACADEVVFRISETKQIPSSGYVYTNAVAIESGKKGNVSAGSINEFAAEYPGIESVTNEAAAFGGMDEESDEDLRKRVISRWQNPTTGGSKGDYLSWALEVPGVRRARVYNPSAGNVQIYVIGVADAEEVADYIEARRPVGANISVSGATAVSVNIAVRISKDEAHTTAKIREDIYERLVAYFEENAFAISTVSFAKLADCMFVDGVNDVISCTLNGVNTSIELDEDEYAVLGTLTVTV